MRDFNVNKLAITLNSIIQRKTRQSKMQAFDSVSMYSGRMRLLEAKTQKQRIFRVKAQVYRAWRVANEQDKRDRELEEIEMHERLLN